MRIKKGNPRVDIISIRGFFFADGIKGAVQDERRHTNEDVFLN